MNIADKSYTNKILAIILIILLTLSDFLFVGTGLISYALDIVNTNNENVEFMAYFLNDANEKIDKIEKNIDKEAKLYLDISVKREGYFNGKVTLNDANFNFKQEQKSEYISEITPDTATLKQINAGSTITLELEIEPKVSDSINIKTLSGETNVSLEGNYVNSKNVEKNTYTEIKGIDIVEVDWKSSEETEAKLETELLTNYVYQINNEEKRILQILVKSNITANNYPVKNTYIALKVPENVEDVKVHTRSTDATNREANFDENSYVYNDQNKILKIKLSNKDTENISWNKNAQDIFVITCIFNKQENLENKDIIVGSLIETYDDKNLSAKQEVHIDNEIDGIVSCSIENIEDSIYKGKIYTKEEREYSKKTIVNIDHLDILNKIEIYEEPSKFISNEEEINANIVYKSIKINKQEFLKIFGEDGYITIKDENGIVIANVNKEQESDENGDIVINLLEGTKKAVIETSKPIALGSLNIESKKAILDSELEREQVDTLTAIKEGSKSNQITATNTITLKNTETEANLKINSKNTLTAEDNVQMEIEATLLANDESKDLYKNPKVTFVFPSEITLDSVKYAALYKNGLEIESSTTRKNENGENIVEINFKGEQEKYDYAEGTKIYLKAQVKVDKQTESKTSDIKMIYTNENKTETKQTNAEFEIEAVSDLEMPIQNENNNEVTPQIQTSNQIESQQRLNTNLSLSKTSETENGINVSISAVSANKNLSENEDIYEGQTIKYEITVTNNTGKDYSNVQIKANQKNGYVWDWCDEEVVNYYYSEDVVIEHFYEIKNSNEIVLEKLENLKNGESHTYIYEASTYTLNNQNIDGTKTYGSISIVSEDGNLNENIETIKNNIKSAELKVDLIDINSKENTCFSGDSISTELCIENLTDNVQNDVKIQIVLLNNLNWGEENSNLNNFFSISSIIDRIRIDGKEINENGNSVVNLTISSINEHEQIRIPVAPGISKIEGKQGSIDMVTCVKTASQKEYISNNLTRTIYNNTRKLDVTQEVELSDGSKINVDKDVLQDGETIKLIGTIANNDDTEFHPYITYKIDKALEIQNAILSNGEQEDYTEKINANELTIDEKVIDANKSIQIIIIAKINGKNVSKNKVTNDFSIMDKDTYRFYSSIFEFSVNKILPISNLEEKGTITIREERKEENIIIGPESNLTEQDDNGESKQEDSNKTDEENKNENNNENKDENNNENNIKGSSSSKQDEFEVKGTVWVDANEDGKRTDDEEKLKDIKVGAINTTTKKIVKTTKTDSNGEYILNLPQGNYIIIFMYDDGLYKITTYQAEGATNSNNSDVISKSVTIDNETVTVGATDSLNISSNISNIDMGLVLKSTFDLQLLKYISKVTVTNSAGTKTYEQKDNTTLTKVEIKSKNLTDSLVIIEYKLKITNVGDIEGYAKNIVDYLPESLSFNSNLNSDWYKSGEYVYNKSLANTKIKPGESKELTLTVTKKMTESNTGLVNNKAKIDSSSNTLGIEDLTDEEGSADVIISVSTGKLISYITLILSIFVILFAIFYILNRKNLDIEKR